MVYVSKRHSMAAKRATPALMRASERARRLAEQTGTRFVVRSPATRLKEGLGPTGGAAPDSEVD